MKPHRNLVVDQVYREPERELLEPAARSPPPGNLWAWAKRCPG